MSGWHHQPILPAGYNSGFNNGDEVDGAGYNEEIGTVYLLSFAPLQVLIITPELMSLFASECADFVVPCQPDTVTFPHELETLVMRESAA